MCGEDETMDLHSHCCRCHTVSVRWTSIHTPVGERNKCALCRRRRGRGARRRVQKESANAFESRRLVFSHKPYLPVVFLGLLVCSQIGYYPQEDREKVAIKPLAKPGYKPHMNYKSLIIHLYFWLFNNANQVICIRPFLPFFSSHFWILKTSRIASLFLKLSIFNFAFSRHFASKKSRSSLPTRFLFTIFLLAKLASSIHRKMQKKGRSYIGRFSQIRL